MVRFHEHIISDLMEDPSGGLVVLSAGLGLPKLISSLLTLHDPSQGSVLILNASSSQKNSIDINSHFSSITSDLPAHHRLSLYTSGGIFFITARILIVDLLTQRLPTTSVAGIILLNAHSISDTSTEAFIVRILRSSNRSLYVRAFSDRPHAMVSGFAKAERTLKCLFLRKLHLWPRFQVYVSQDLEKDPPEVIDIRVPMSPHMIGIQKAVIEVMDACLKEMRKTNKVDVEDLTVENGLFKSFDEIVRRQLDPIWHTLGKRTKQLVSDLKTLRKLLDYLSRYDAVTYLKYLDSLRASESFRSVWIFAESSYKIFEYAKKRVYHFGRSDSGKSIGMSTATSARKRKLEERKNGDDSSASANSVVVLQEILEEPPKWKVLRDILVEIQEERQKQAVSGEELIAGCDEDLNGIILVACKDERSCMQLQDCITKGHHKVMHEEWEKYLLSKVELQALPKSSKKKPKAPKGFGILDGVIPSVSGQKAEVSSISKQENDALLAAAYEISKQANKDTGVEHSGASEEHGKGRKNRRKKKKPIIGKTDQESETSVQSKTSPSKHKDKVNEHLSISGNVHGNSTESEYLDRVVLRKHNQEPENTSQLPSVHFHALESEQNILDVLQPSVIIVYHPDMAFVREIEIYKSENPSKRLKVYFLFYEDSTEIRKFEASVRRENGAFESLIRQKSLMMIPVSQDEQLLSIGSSVEPQSVTAQNLITRKAGGKKEAEKEMQIIVDMREFMSSLPNVLHQKGMHIIPVTLEVGDYILSPLICVERKSIQDLFGSFSSGRLYHQVEMMSRYYRIPVLLIEFSQDKSFSFQSASEIGDDVTPNSIISKLSLLVLHFPRLRIVWSRSLHATAEIFTMLKANQDEPDEAKAIRVGVPSEDGIIENDVRAENFNTSAVEFLRRLPGVTDSNYRSIMDGCKSLAELALLPIEKLADLMGGQKAAKTLRDFLDAKYPTLL
ncbi:Structure-specific endonuclease ERCC1-XPF, catalytic component XPF/ERCC4 [Handroanthus impetiginosus]|uniref:Structure-specific endonuclease ERCC1-XPF, catalytic component XPF/ERCC4 n=1 Tax=Handroanthus impetiginosus TaxID=429701 RepID=A0A2G9GTT3_9LAMI|nr:Structure-specific endonuclease ERCC1-XPF, catalytic component XPF/ERCC4 [Handroanthus impetiginosus]